jgi:hypothetical protein
MFEMKKLFFLIATILLMSGYSSAQYKIGNPNLNESTNNMILGIFNTKNFSMSHSFSMNVLSSRFGSYSVTSYINTMSYKFSDKLNVSADVSLNYSPYASSVYGKEFAKGIQNDLNGITLSRLNLNYKISDNASFVFEYRNMKNDFYNPFYGYNSFYDDIFYNRR